MSSSAQGLLDLLGDGAAPVRWLAQTESTNADARAWAAAGAPHGAVIVADAQSAGRGRQGRTWESSGGALLLSIVLRPEIPPSAAPLLCLGAAVATARVCGGPFRIKWPNNVLAPDGRKVAGILAELETLAGALDYVVVGIGVNVSAAPALPTATHLEAVEPRGRDRVALAASLVRGVLDEARAVKDDPGSMLERWRLRSQTLGSRVEVAGITGTAVDIEADGGLRLRLDDGSERRILAGDVRMIA